MNPPTFPARPMNGGPLDRAREKPEPEAWFYEPKINGWRVLIDVKNKKMWTRYNRPSSVEHKYAAVLERIAAQFSGDEVTWLDGEILGQRASSIGRGSLVIFDVAWPRWKDWSILHDRRRLLDVIFDNVSEVWDIDRLPSQDTIYRLPRISGADALEYYERMQIANQRFGLELYEGVVAKNMHKEYPTQLRSATEETPWWVKHRWD
jgi:ATP-dependent DNA ligase